MLLAPLFPALPLTVFSCCVLFAPSPPASCVTGLRRGGGGRKGERVKEIKGIPLPFSLPPNPPYPFLSRLPPFERLDQGIHFGSILLFFGFKENTELGWKSATSIFFFQEERKLYFFSFLKGSVLKERLMLCPGGEWNRRIFFGRVY